MTMLPEIKLLSITIIIIKDRMRSTVESTARFLCSTHVVIADFGKYISYKKEE